MKYSDPRCPESHVGVVIDAHFGNSLESISFVGLENG